MDGTHDLLSEAWSLCCDEGEMPTGRQSKDAAQSKKEESSPAESPTVGCPSSDDTSNSDKAESSNENTGESDVNGKISDVTVAQAESEVVAMDVGKNEFQSNEQPKADSKEEMETKSEIKVHADGETPEEMTPSDSKITDATQHKRKLSDETETAVASQEVKRMRESDNNTPIPVCSNQDDSSQQQDDTPCTFSLKDIGISLNAKGEVTLSMPDKIKDLVKHNGSVNINFDMNYLDSNNCLKFRVTEEQQVENDESDKDNETAERKKKVKGAALSSDSSVQVDININQPQAKSSSSFLHRNVTSRGFVSYPQFTHVSGSSIVAVHKVMKNVKKGLSIDSRTKKPTWFCSLCNLTGDYGDMGPLFGPFDLKIPPKNSYKNKHMSESAKNLFQKLSSTLNQDILQLEDDNITLEREEVWLHEDCICWSPGVYMIGFDVYGLEELFKVARFTVCTTCGEIGASLGCFKEGCVARYHFRCAMATRCKLINATFTVLCPNHAHGVVDNCLTVKPFMKVRNFLSPEEIMESENLLLERGGDAMEEREKAVKITKTRIIRSRHKQGGDSKKSITIKKRGRPSLSTLSTPNFSQESPPTVQDDEMMDCSDSEINVSREVEREDTVVQCQHCTKSWIWEPKLKTHRIADPYLEHIMKQHCPNSCHDAKLPCSDCRVTVERALKEDCKEQTFPCYTCVKNFSNRASQSRHFAANSEHHRALHMAVLDKKMHQRKGSVPCFGCGAFILGELKNLKNHFLPKPHCIARHQRIYEERKSHLNCLSCSESYSTGLKLHNHLSHHPQCKETHAQRQLQEDGEIMCCECLLIFEKDDFIKHVDGCPGLTPGSGDEREDPKPPQTTPLPGTKKMKPPTDLVPIPHRYPNGVECCVCQEKIAENPDSEDAIFDHMREVHCNDKVCFKEHRCEGCTRKHHNSLSGKIHLSCTHCDMIWACTALILTARKNLVKHFTDAHCSSSDCDLSKPCGVCSESVTKILDSREWQFFPCFSCGKTLQNQSSHCSHVLHSYTPTHSKDHLRQLYNIPETDLKAGIHACFGCGIICSNRGMVKHLGKVPECWPRHKMVLDARSCQNGTCLACEVVFPTKVALMKHLSGSNCTEKHAQRLLRLPPDQIRMCFECGRIYDAEDFPGHLQDCLTGTGGKLASQQGQLECFGCESTFPDIRALNNHVRNTCKAAHIAHILETGVTLEGWTVCYGCGGYHKSSRIGVHLAKELVCVHSHFEILRKHEELLPDEVQLKVEEYGLTNFQSLVVSDVKERHCLHCEVFSSLNLTTLRAHLAERRACRAGHVAKSAISWRSLPPGSEGCMACGVAGSPGFLSRHFKMVPECASIYEQIGDEDAAREFGEEMGVKEEGEEDGDANLPGAEMQMEGAED